VVLVVSGAASGTLRPVFGLIAGALAVWVRPEGAFFLVAVPIQVWAQKEIKHWRRYLLPLALAVAGGGLVLLIVRLAVFSEILPNTFHAKEPSIGRGLQYWFGYFSSLPGALLLLVGLLGAWLGSLRHRGYLAAALAWMLAAVLEGGDWMPLGRFLTPALVLLALAATGVVAPGKQRSRPFKWLVPVGLVVVVFTAGVMLWRSWGLAETAERSDSQHCRDARELADWVARNGFASVALVDIGRMGFRAPGAEIFDLGGLTDKIIAAAPGGLLAKRFDLGYLFDQRRPELIVIRLDRLPARDHQGRLAPTPDDTLARVEKDVLADSRLGDLYAPMFLLVPQTPRKHLYARMVFIRRGVAAKGLPKSDMILATELN